jgi:UDP:flavonoid glycosyltransferase YjiC (YdhE family)
MRILVTTRGSSGHVTPLAPFAHAALAAGHDVLVAAHAPHAGNVERLGLPFAPVDPAPPEVFRGLLMQLPELDLDTANDRVFAEYFGRLDTRAALPSLRALVELWQPDVILRESWEFASVLVGELYDIPVVRVALGLATTEAMVGRLVPSILDELRAELGLEPDPEGRAVLEGPCLSAVPELLDDAPRAVHRVRTETPAATPAGSLPDAWWPGVARGAPLVYVTFGSVAAGEHMPFFPALYRTAIAALAALPVRVLVTLGEDRDVAALGPLPANVHVERWIPQDAVLPHAALMVAHGGYGTTLGALAHGVPQVLVPLFSIDQWANAAAVDAAGAGIALDADRATRRVLDLPGEATAEGLGGAVARVLNHVEYAKAARRIAAAMAELPPAAAALDVLGDAVSVPAR